MNKSARLLIIKAWDNEGTSFSVWETTTPENPDSGRSYRNTYPNYTVFRDQIEMDWRIEGAEIVDLTHLGLKHLNMSHDEILTEIKSQLKA